MGGRLARLRAYGDWRLPVGPPRIPSLRAAGFTRAYVSDTPPRLLHVMLYGRARRMFP